MKKRNVIKSSNLRARSPILVGLVFYLSLDKWNAPEWLYGALGLLVLIWLITYIKDLADTTEIDLFADDKDINKKKSFQEKLIKKIKDEET